MDQSISLWRQSIFVLFSIFFASGCSSPSQKTIHKSFLIEISQMKFMPAALAVQNGDTITWINKDLVTHDVTEELNKEWTSSPMPSGKSWSMVATKSADYYCSIHLVMKGKITVQ
jgi:plastocyanin